MEALIKLANNIKFYRERNGWTQEYIGGQLNVSRTNISKWESGDAVPSVVDLLQLSTLFHVTLDQLVGTSIFSQEYLVELNRKYHSEDGKLELSGVIDYLLQNPRMMNVLTQLSDLKPSERKKLEDTIIFIIQKFSR